jgi:hypothetical protein
VVSAAFTILFALTSCERKTVVRLEGGNPPTFLMSGSGRLGAVIIFGPEQERIASSDPFDDTYAVWEIAAEKEGEEGAARVEDLRSITFGVVPKGYKQIKPKGGPPPSLSPGKRYRYWLVTVNAPHDAGYVEIRDGKPALVDGP